MSDDSNNGESKVGYAHPPKEHQFQPGQSGNPKGRPKGSKSSKNLMSDLLSGKIKINIEGKTRKVSKREAIALGLLEMGLKKDPKALVYLYENDPLNDVVEEVREEPRALTEAELAIMTEYLARKKGDLEDG